MDKSTRVLILASATDAAIPPDLHPAGSDPRCVMRRAITLEDFSRELLEFRPDVVLMVDSLTGATCSEVIGTAREADPLLPVILLTDVVEEAAAVECLRAGAADYVLRGQGNRLVPAIVAALERRRVSGTMARQLELVQAVFDATSDAIFVKDLEGRYILANRAAEKILGRSRGEMMNADDLTLMPEEQGRRIMENDRQIIASGQTQIIQEQIRNGEGELRDFHATKGPLHDREGMLLGLFGIGRDITVEKRAEQRFRELSHAVEFSPATVVVTDAEGNITYVNQKFTEVTGYRPEEVLGRNPRVLKSGETPPETYRELWRTILSGDTWTGELHNRRKNGELFWEAATISGLRDADGRVSHFIAVKEDITARRLLELQLRQSMKLEGVGQLAGGVAHDFNNLLSVIMGYSELAIARTDPGNPLQKYLEEIRKASERAAGLTRQLLAFSRKQVLQPRVVDLNQVIREMEKMLRRLIPENVQIHLELDAGTSPLYLDRSQLEQVLMNLCVNARDAMPRGGTLTIATRPRTIDSSEPLPAPDAVPGTFMELSVTDNGTGMDPAIRDRVFEPFFTTKEVGQGTGLGLATVYGIVKQSGGFITLESTPGVGTRFEILFPPAGPDHAANGKETGIQLEEISRGTETIFLVEDDPGVRIVCTETLKEAGYRILAAAGGREALDLFLVGDPAPDLLVTDVVMPGISGPEVARRLLEFYPDCGVLYMSGYSGNMLALPEAGGAELDLLHKPFRPADLARRVREALDRRRRH